MSNWPALIQELRLWQQQGLVPTLWWRDDDCQQDTAALRRLSQLSLDYQIPLHLAVIPRGADASLKSVFFDNPWLFALQHGYSHRNHAPKTERKCELGEHRPLSEVVHELQQGREYLNLLLGQQVFVPLLVPPWNRVTDTLLPHLSEIGLVGLSTLGPRLAERCYQLPQVNVHIDIIDWKIRSFAGDQRVLSQLLTHLQGRREGLFDVTEATGLMTHHLAHDEQCWEFCQRLFEVMADYGGQWQEPSQLFPE
ncbi:MAG: polysaccharide deacetylase family protein [Motiliproteus sp.]